MLFVLLNSLLGLGVGCFFSEMLISWQLCAEGIRVLQHAKLCPVSYFGCVQHSRATFPLSGPGRTQCKTSPGVVLLAGSHLTVCHHSEATGPAGISPPTMDHHPCALQKVPLGLPMPGSKDGGASFAFSSGFLKELVQRTQPLSILTS